MPTTPSISVVITSHNEGKELHRTIKSVIANTEHLTEIIVVDDGSTDGSCQEIECDDVRMIRHVQRLGVAISRDEGSRAASGEVLCYLDGHQRVGKKCLNHCARLAVDRCAITCPDVRGYSRFGWRLHGASFRLCPVNGYFSSRWRQWFSLPGAKQITGLCAPPYLVPRDMYEDLAWSRSLRGWGASEAAIVVKAFFLGVPIVHLAGPLARHRFQREFHYATTWEGIWRNQAIIARICFDDSTWFRYWLPKVFDAHLSQEARATLDSAAVQLEHERFLSRKKRTDEHFWLDLLGQSCPLVG
jgi:glycosyltransferase involved in cell wall biosynthesis